MGSAAFDSCGLAPPLLMNDRIVLADVVNQAPRREIVRTAVPSSYRTMNSAASPMIACGGPVLN
jgi:hypothetical protein